MLQSSSFPCSPHDQEMESLPTALVTDSNNDEDNDTELLSLLINERQAEYSTLENVNPLSTAEDYKEDDPYAVNESENAEVFGDYERYLQDIAYLIGDIPADEVEYKLSEGTWYPVNDSENECILQLGKQIQNNISECRRLTTEATAILGEKLNLQRELNYLKERLSCQTLEETKFKKLKKKRGSECANTGSLRRTYFCRFGIPYFKTKERFPAAQNEDLKEIIRNNEVMIIRMPQVRRFLPHDARKLESSILNQLKCKRIENLQSQVRKLKSEDNDDYTQQKHNLLTAIENAKSTQDIQDTKTWNIPVDFLALTKLNSRFTVEDYERMWQLLGEPNICKEDFSSYEVKKLKDLVEQHRSQDWDRIASELGTNRTGFVCFTKWVSLSKKGSHKPWTEEENKLLFKLGSKFDHIKDPAAVFHWWRHIRRQFPHRTYNQIHGHWKYKLAPEKKGRFTDEETEKLVSLIQEGKSFGEISSIFGTRSSVQLRSHYCRLVECGSYNSGPWTNDEEVILFQLVEKYGMSNWVQISKELGTRTRSQCRLKFLQNAWNPSEKEMFERLIEKYETDFEKISMEIGTKTVGQCRQYYLRQKDAERGSPYRQGRWTRKENRLFLILVKKYGDDYESISRELKTRNVEQCQAKYARTLAQNIPFKRISIKNEVEEDKKFLDIYKVPEIKSTRWTKSDEKRFAELVECHGQNMEKISAALGNKTIVQCRNMYNKLTQEKSKDVSERNLSPQKKKQKTI